jgi:hypothetical protein
MFKFIRYFILAWKEYSGVMRFIEMFKRDNPEEYEKMCESDRAHGIDPEYKSRFDYALKTARFCYAHRDRYGRKCRKAGGDCDNCNAKHC